MAPSHSAADSCFPPNHRPFNASMQASPCSGSLNATEATPSGCLWGRKEHIHIAQKKSYLRYDLCMLCVIYYTVFYSCAYVGFSRKSRGFFFLLTSNMMTFFTSPNFSHSVLRSSLYSFKTRGSSWIEKKHTLHNVFLGNRVTTKKNSSQHLT